MKAWRRVLGLGVLAWLGPFLVAVLLFPFRESNSPLFESILAVAVTTNAVVLGLWYLKRVFVGSPKEGLLVGLVWAVMCMLIDLPMFVFGSTMKMTLGAYLADIGITYLSIPAVTTGLAIACARGPQRASVS